MEPPRLKLPNTPEQEGQTVDKLLRGVLHLSGTVIRRIKWLPDGILLDGVRVFVSQKVRTGQTLCVRVGDTALRSGMVPVEGPLDLVYEDGDLVVIDKAPGVPSHPGPGHYCDTVGNYLAFHYQQAGVLADYHPVHRLDRGTSGLMVVAKHAHAQERLKEALHTPAFRRRYLAVCDGVPRPTAGVVDAPLGRQAGSLMARQVDPDGQSARTRYRVLGVWEGRALVELELDTGRTHQIRVHMAHLGCPLTGDFLYGVEDPALIGRPALHAWALDLIHPITGQPMGWRSVLPGDMARLAPPGLRGGCPPDQSWE